MRHLIGFLLALAALAALYFGAARGVTEILALRGAAGRGWPPLGHGLTSTPGLLALGGLLGTGVLIGVLVAVRRISALASGLPGAVLLGWSALYVLRGGEALRYLPLRGSSFGAGAAYLVGNGALALAGAAMIVPLFLPSRWRRAVTEAEDYEDAGEPAPTGLLP